MGDQPWIWWVIAAAVLLIALLIFLWVNRRKKRARAVELRKQAKADDPRITEQEAIAKDVHGAAIMARREADELQEEADRAEGRAQALEERAAQAVSEARAQRDDQMDTYLDADRVDPDSKR
ncbi:MAG: LPXTG cell wall anchor domain-containing protein [Ornithinimicrobium sp.]